MLLKKIKASHPYISIDLDLIPQQDSSTGTSLVILAIVKGARVGVWLVTESVKLVKSHFLLTFPESWCFVS